MSELKYHKIPTSNEVYREIVKKHSNKDRQDIGVYESYTNIVENGICTIYTVWGLKRAEVALVGAKTTYETEDDKEVPDTRMNEYWLCAAYLEEEE